MLKMTKAPAAQKPGKSAAAMKSKASGSKVATGGREALLGRVEAVRLAQRKAGHFDCFAKARGGYCDQSGCAYHSECVDISPRL